MMALVGFAVLMVTAILLIGAGIAAAWFDHLWGGRKSIGPYLIVALGGLMAYATWLSKPFSIVMSMN